MKLTYGNRWCIVGLRIPLLIEVLKLIWFLLGWINIHIDIQSSILFSSFVFIFRAKKIVFSSSERWLVCTQSKGEVIVQYLKIVDFIQHFLTKPMICSFLLNVTRWLFLNIYENYLDVCYSWGEFSNPKMTMGFQELEI